MTRQPPAVRGLGAAHDQQRRNILESVFAIVDTEGVDQVTIRNVARTAKVSAGRVQHYFPTKDAILSEAFAAINEAGTESVQRRLTDLAPADSETIVTIILTELIPGDEDRRRLVRVAQAFEVYALTRPGLKAQITHGYEALVELIAGLLPPGSGRGSTAVEAPQRRSALSSARELVALANGLGGMVVTDSIPVSEARQLVIERVRQTVRERSA